MLAAKTIAISRVICLAAAFFALSACTTTKPDSSVKDGVIRLENPVLQLQVQQYGGHYIDLQLKENPVNPLSWAKTPETMPKFSHKDAVYKGHFLCMGRIGRPSDGEIKAGVPMRGEQTARLWTLNDSGTNWVDMECEAPLDGLNVQRKIELHPASAQFLVTEHFENTGSLGRVHNVLQHVTLGTPFISEHLLINSNAKQGFCSKHGYPDPHSNEYFFPQARLDTQSEQITDLRTTSKKFLSTHIFDADDEYAWVTAYDPHSGLVIGYIWKIADYPWINFWNRTSGKNVPAVGLEFGTAGVDGTYQQLLETDVRFHGVRSWEFIDAGETIEKSFIGFLVQLEQDAKNPELTREGNHFLLNGKIQLFNLLK